MKITVFNGVSRQQAARAVQSRALPCVVTIADKDTVRGLTANALMWVWITAISEHTGESKAEVHERLKDTFLARIYERDDPDYADLMQSLRDLYRIDPEKALALKKHVVRMTTTTKAKPKQMTEYMNDIKMDAFDNLGLILTSEVT